MYFIDVAREDIEAGDLVCICNGVIRKCHEEIDNKKDAELIDEVLYEMYDILVELG